MDSPFEDGDSSDFEMPAKSSVGSADKYLITVFLLKYTKNNSQKVKPVTKKLSKEPTKPKVAPKKTLQTTLKPAKIASKKRTKPDSDVENTDLSMDDDSAGDGSHLSVTPPSAKKHKKLPAPKKTGGQPLQPIDNDTHGLDNVSTTQPKKQLSATEQYQRVSSCEDVNMQTHHLLTFVF